MLSRMKKFFQPTKRVQFVYFTLSISGSFGLWSCNQNLVFSSAIESQRAIDKTPDSPTPAPPSQDQTSNPTLPTPSLTKSNGTCSADGSTQLTSCMKCDIPANPPQQPPLSNKAKSLYGIMTKACAFLAQKYPQNYHPLPEKKVLEYLNRCTTSDYVDSNMSNMQQSVVTALNDETSDSLRQKMFGGLWYQPPYSTAFETYFGLEVQEAAAVFCQGHLPLNGKLVDIGYWQSPDPDHYQLPAEYVAANVFRNQLKGCISTSLNQPWQPAPVPPQKKCKFELIEGQVNEEYRAELTRWLSQGWKIGLEKKDSALCQSLGSATDITKIHGHTKAVAYICE